MTIRWSLRRWSSRADRDLHAAELLPSPADGDAMAIALARVAGDLAGAAFLVVGVGGVEASAVGQAVESFQRAGGRARLCLAGDRATLGAIDAAAIDCDRVGLLLDDVDADTPLSELVWSRIEAVRFSADFVARAALDLRLGYALESMLGLARDLGLCTLGIDALPDGASVAGRADFDYLAMAAAWPPARMRESASSRSAAVTASR